MLFRREVFHFFVCFHLAEAIGIEPPVLISWPLLKNMIRVGIHENVAMMISGHKSGSIFDRYNLVSDTDLKLAARMHETYLKRRAGTITKIDKRKRYAISAKPRFYWCLGPESNRHDTKYRGILSPLRLPIPPPRHPAKI